MSCNNQIYLKSKDMFVDCGKCYGCKKKKSSEWSIRLQCELTTNPKALFCTFTYDNDHLLSVNLDKSDYQNFMKRLRFNLDGRPIKYYAVGEYGEQSFRKHFHAIIFGIFYEDTQIINDSWQNGIVDIAPVEIGSINYTVGYIQKKLDLSDDYYINLGFTPTFSLMSRGIGLEFVLKNYDYLRQRKYIQIGKNKYPLPRYFRNILGLTINDKEYDDYVKKITAEKNRELQDQYKTVPLSENEIVARKNLVETLAQNNSNISYKDLNLRYIVNDSREYNLKVKNSLYKRSKI